MGRLGFDFNIMLQQFSWGHFLISAIVLNLVWYFFVGLVFYRAEVMAFLGLGDAGAGGVGAGSIGRDGKGQGLVKAKDGYDDAIEREVDAALMGRSRLPEGVEVKGSGEVRFAASASGEDLRYDQVGLVADVVQELKALFTVLEQKAGDKRDFFRMLARVKEDYGPLGGHPSVGALTGFIVERAPFHLSPDEVDNLWY